MVETLILSSAFATREKVLHGIYGISFLGASIIFTLVLLSTHDSFGLVLICTIGILCTFIGFLRFIDKAFEGEKVSFENNSFKIIQHSIFCRKIRIFNIKDVEALVLLEQEKFSKHPLSGEAVDYFGFDTEQKVIQDLNTSGRIAFMYRGQEVRFGKHIYTWEYDKLINLFTRYKDGHQ